MMPLFQYSRLTGTLPRAATLLYLPINKSNNKQLLLPPFPYNVRVPFSARSVAKQHYQLPKQEDS